MYVCFDSNFVTIGFSCTLYMMHIKDEGVYIPVQIKRFFLPEVRENLVNVPSVVEGFLFVKVYYLKRIED